MDESPGEDIGTKGVALVVPNGLSRGHSGVARGAEQGACQKFASRCNSEDEKGFGNKVTGGKEVVEAQGGSGDAGTRRDDGIQGHEGGVIASKGIRFRSILGGVGERWDERWRSNCSRREGGRRGSVHDGEG